MTDTRTATDRQEETHTPMWIQRRVYMETGSRETEPEGDGAPWSHGRLAPRAAPRPLPRASGTHICSRGCGWFDMALCSRETRGLCSQPVRQCGAQAPSRCRPRLRQGL